jgi:hypothetical protein
LASRSVAELEWFRVLASRSLSDLEWSRVLASISVAEYRYIKYKPGEIIITSLKKVRVLAPIHVQVYNIFH